MKRMRFQLRSSVRTNTTFGRLTAEGEDWGDEPEVPAGVVAVGAGGDGEPAAPIPVTANVAVTAVRTVASRMRRWRFRGAVLRRAEMRRRVTGAGGSKTYPKRVILALGPAAPREGAA